MTDVPRGYDCPVDAHFDASKDISVSVSVEGPDGCRFLCLGLDPSGRPGGGDWMIGPDDRASPARAVVLKGGRNCAAFAVNLAGIPDGIDRLDFVAAPGGGGAPDGIREMAVVLVQGGRQLSMEVSSAELSGAGLSGAAALTAAALRRSGGAWRLELSAAARRGGPGDFDLPGLLRPGGADAPRPSGPVGGPGRLSLEKAPLAGAGSGRGRLSLEKRPDAGRPRPAAAPPGSASSAGSAADPPSPVPDPAGPSPAAAPSELGRLQALAARGDHGAELELGRLMWRGSGGSAAIRAEAAGLLERSAGGGVPQAMLELARISFDRNSGRHSPGIGILMLKQAVATGRLGAGELGAALNDLGVRYKTGDGVDRDLPAAFEFFRSSAERSNPVGKLNLAWCYLTGEGVGRDEKKGRALIRELRKSKDAFVRDRLRRAMLHLKRCEKPGELSPKGFTAALVLCILFGTYGLHRFYVRKFLTGALFLLTGGLLVFGWLFDIWLLLAGRFRDSDGLLVKSVKGLRDDSYAVENPPDGGAPTGP